MRGIDIKALIATIVLLAAFFISVPVLAADGIEVIEEDELKFFTVTLDNDLFFNEDNGYSNGIGVAWAHGNFSEFNSENTPSILLPFVNASHLAYRSNDKDLKTQSRAISHSIAQFIQTPNDLEVASLINNDLPYAGGIIAETSFHSFNDKISNRLSVEYGFVGPSALGEEAQKFVHEIIDSKDPKGWDNQLQDELVFGIGLERANRLLSTRFGSVELDLVSTIGAKLGNFESNVQVAASVRAGSDLTFSLPGLSILPGRNINPLAGSHFGAWEVSVSLIGLHVFNALYIEGNNFRDSHGLELEHDQLIATVGASINLGQWSVLLAAAFPSDSFVGQGSSDEHGTLSFTYRY